MSYGRDCGEPQLQVRGVSAVNERVDVVLDSGSDATIVPASFRGVGMHKALRSRLMLP